MQLPMTINTGVFNRKDKDISLSRTSGSSKLIMLHKINASTWGSIEFLVNLTNTKMQTNVWRCGNFFKKIRGETNCYHLIQLYQRNYMSNAQAVEATKNIVAVKHFFSSWTHCQNIFHVSIVGFGYSYDLLTSVHQTKYNRCWMLC